MEWDAEAIEQRVDRRLQTDVPLRDEEGGDGGQCTEASGSSKAADQTKSVAHTDHFWAKSFARFMNGTDKVVQMRQTEQCTSHTAPAEISKASHCASALR